MTEAWSHFSILCDDCGWTAQLVCPNEDAALDSLRVRLREHADEMRHYGSVTGEWESLDKPGVTGELRV